MRGKNRLEQRVLLTTGTAIAFVAFGTPAFAQGVEAQGEEGAGLEDIVVTARKVEENLQQTPIAITVLSAETMKAQGITNVREVVFSAPNVVIGGDLSGRSNSNFAIRGQTQFEANSAVDQSVAVYRDGVYVARSRGVLSNMFDMERVEILKGPQGTLFGRNTTGGAIMLYSKLPKDYVEAGLTVRKGNYDLTEVEGYLNLPLSGDNVAIRLSGGLSDNSGFGRNTIANTELGSDNLKSLRGILRLEPDAGPKILVVGDWSRGRFRPKPAKLLYYNYAGPTSVGARPASQVAVELGLPLTPPLTAVGSLQTAANVFASQINALGDPYSIDSFAVSPLGVNHAFDNFDQWGAALTVSHDIGSVTLKSVSAYRKLSALNFQDLDGTRFNILSSSAGTKQDQFTQELQLSGKALNDSLQYVAGLYYFTESAEDASFSSQFPGVNPVRLTRAAASIDNRSVAAFAQLSYEIVPSLSLTAGGRYTHEKKSVLVKNRLTTASGADVCGVPTSLLPDPGVCKAPLSRKFDGWTYTFSLDYQPAEDMLLYARTSRGFRSGGFNSRGSAAVADAFAYFAPETVTDYELGAKLDLFDRRVRVNAALFRSKYNDIQKSVVLFSGTQYNKVVNAAKATIDGLEVEIMARPVPSITLGASGSWLDARYNSYTVQSLDISGQAFYLSPKYKASVFGQFEHDIGNWGKISARVDYSWVDKVNFGTAQVVKFDKAIAYEPGYGLVNGRIGVSLDNPSLEIAAFVKNLTDKRYNSSRLVQDNTLGYVIGTAGDPRTFGVEISYRFGR